MTETATYMQLDHVALLVAAVSGFVSACILPLIARRQTRKDKHDKNCDELRAVLDAADYELQMASRHMMRETAQAVVNKKCNGELTAAIAKFDTTFEEQNKVKGEALKQLMKI